MPGQFLNLIYIYAILYREVTKKGKYRVIMIKTLDVKNTK